MTSLQIPVPDSLSMYHDDVVGEILAMHGAKWSNERIAEYEEITPDEVRAVLDAVADMRPGAPSHLVQVHALGPNMVGPEERERRKDEVWCEHLAAKRKSTPDVDRQDRRERHAVKTRGRRGQWCYGRE